MNGRTLLEKVKKEQSYYIEGTYRNEYTGFDVWKLGGIKQDNKIYALAHRGVVDALRNGREIDPQFFIDKATVDEFVDQKTGRFDSRKLSESVQVKPYHNNIMVDEDCYATYRNSIVCCDVNKEFEVPLGVCENNDQFGEGRAHQSYIPREMVNEMLKTGALVYNEADSFIGTGYNFELSKSEYEDIEAKSLERCDICEREGRIHFKEGKDESRHIEPIKGEMFGNENWFITHTETKIDKKDTVLTASLRPNIEVTRHRPSVLDIPEIKMTVDNRDKTIEKDKEDRSNIDYKINEQERA